MLDEIRQNRKRETLICQSRKYDILSGLLRRRPVSHLLPDQPRLPQQHQLRQVPRLPPRAQVADGHQEGGGDIHAVHILHAR